jgi:acyl-CoA dehydrogenase
VYVENTPTNPLGQLEAVFKQRDELEPLFDKIREAVKAGGVKRGLGRFQIQMAQTASVITETEAKLLLNYNAVLMEVIHVDHFDERELVRQTVDLSDLTEDKKSSAI